MSVVDNRVVKMAFDNQDFEKNVGTTLSTLDKLKSALKLDKAVEGLKGISNTAKGVSFDAIDNGIYTVQSSFNALDVIATRVLQNITDMAFNTGKQLLTAITVEPLKSGLEEYETQINSVQTILANTGDALKAQGLDTEHDRIEKINGVLDDLNKYADMTIYNFTEMTRNIGTFTAAGVELDTAATSIKGIANLAAMSGSNSQQASTAMYQLSQAIAAGSVKLQDWNSVVNAGMGGKLFQQELIDTAKAMGVTDAQFTKLTKGATTFRESLSSGWISAEVLTNTLEKFTAGSEGYTKSQVEQMKKLWEARGYSKTMIDEMTNSLTILTDEEEKNLRTKWAEKGFSEEQINHILEMGTAATDAATKVKTFSQLIDTLKEALQSGWTQSWEYIIGDFEQAKRLWTEISDILNMYIGKSADARNKMLEQWSKATYAYNEAGELIYAADGKLVKGSKMVASEMGGREAVIQSIRNTFQGFLEVAVQFRDAWDWSFWGKNKGDKKNPLEDLSMSGQKLIDMSKQLLDFTENFKKALGTADKPTKLLTDLKNNFDFFATSMRNAYLGIKDTFSGISNLFISFFKSSFFSIDALNSFVTAISSVSSRIRNFGEAVKKHLGNDESGKNREGLIKFFSGLKDILEAQIWMKLDFIFNAFDAFGKVIEHIIGPGQTVATILGDFGEKLSKVADGMNNLFNNEDVSKFETLFNKLADDFNVFFDTLSKVAQFEGITYFFNQLIAIFNGTYSDKFAIIENIFQGLLNIFKALLGVLGPIADAFTDVFGPWLMQAVIYIGELASRFKDFTASLVPSEELMTGIQKLFVGIFTVIQSLTSLLIDTFLSAWDNLSEIFSEILPTGEDLGKTLGDIGDKLKEFGDALKAIVSGESDLPSFADGLDLVTDKIVGFIKAIKNSELLKDVGSIFVDIFGKIKEGLFGTDDQAGALSKIGESLKNFFTNLKIALMGTDGLDVGDIMANGGIIFAIKKFIDFIKDTFGGNKGLFDTIKETISDVGEALCDTFEMIQNRLKFDALQKIAQSILMIAGALFIISLIDSDSLVRSLLTIGILMESMELLMESITKLDGVGVKDIAAVSAAMVSMGAALLLIAFACKLLSTAEPDELARGLIATVILIGALTNAAEDLAQDSGRMMKGAAGLIALAIAVDLLCVAVKILGNMNWDQLALGLGATIGLIFALTKAASLIGSDFSFGDGAGLLLLAFGIKVLANAVSELAQLRLDQLGIGLLGFAASLGLVVVALRVLDKYSSGSELIKDAAAIFIMAQAMKAMASVINTMGSMDWEDLKHGLIGFAAGLAAMSLAAIALEKFGSGEAALGLAAMAASMLLLAEALKIVGSLDFFGQIVPGLIGLAGALAVFVIAAKFITPVMAASMLGVAAAIALLGVGMMAFSAGLATLGVAIATSGASLLWFIVQLKTFLPMMATALANAIAQFIVALARNITSIYNSFKMLGLAALRAIRALLPEIFGLISDTLSGILTLIIEQTPTFFQALKIVAQQFWAFLNSQISNIFNFLTNFFSELFTFLQTEGPMLVETIRLMLDTVLQAIIQETPVIGQTFLTLLQTLLTVIQVSVPEITNTLLMLISSLLQQLAEFAPQMAQSAMEILLGFLNAIAANIGQITESAINIAIAFINGVAQKMPEIVDSAFNLIIQWIDGLATAIENNHDALFDAVGHLIQAIAEAIVDGIDKVVEAGGNLLQPFIDTIGTFVDDVFNAGANLVQGFVDGLMSIPDTLGTAASNLGKTALDWLTGSLDEHSPSKKTEDVGTNFVQGFINGINSLDASSSVTSMASSLLNLFSQPFKNTAFIKAQAFAIIEALAQGISKGTSRMRVLGSAIMQGLSQGISGGVAIARNVAISIVTAITNGLNSAINRVRTIGINIVQGIYISLSSGLGKMRSVANSLVSQFVSGLSSGIGRIGAVARNMASTLRSGVVNNIGSLYNIGRNAITGFINGIASLGSQVMNAARGIAKAASDTIKNALKERSPSKLTFEYGAYFTKGFALGIDSLKNDVSKSSENIAGIALNAFDDLNSIDYDPVVSPVVNMDGANDALDTINKFSDISAQSIDFKPIEYHVKQDLSDYIDWSKKAMDNLSDSLNFDVDYDRLGISVANALIDSGLYVKMDGSQLMGYLASEIKSARRMYG